MGRQCDCLYLGHLSDRVFWWGAGASRLVVVTRGLYLARHLFTLFIYLCIIALIVYFYIILTLVKRRRNDTYTAICASLTTPGGVWARNCCFPPEEVKRVFKQATGYCQAAR